MDSESERGLWDAVQDAEACANHVEGLVAVAEHDARLSWREALRGASLQRDKAARRLRRALDSLSAVQRARAEVSTRCARREPEPLAVSVLRLGWRLLLFVIWLLVGLGERSVLVHMLPAAAMWLGLVPWGRLAGRRRP